MTITPVQALQIDDVLAQQLGSFTRLPKVAAPFTTITNRAQCVDPSNDHLPKFGINRQMFFGLEEVQGETDANGLRVFKLTNDSTDQVRFAGSWINTSATTGQKFQSTVATDYLEIVFYGTGLNLLVYQDGTARTMTLFVDGVSTATITNTSTSSVLNGRNYNQNTILQVVNGLTLGTHTVKLVNTGAAAILYGYEVLNTNSTLQYVKGSSYAGSKKVSNTALTTDTYNSNFASGTLNAAGGGHVVVYQTATGIAKAIQSNSVSPVYLASATHTNESIIRTYNWIEFGAGRSDDFSSLATSGANNAAFTLDDGTTSLVGSSVDSVLVGGVWSLIHSTTSSFFTIVFVGTGLDVIIANNGASASDTYALTVDGVSGGSFSYASSTPPQNTGGTIRLVSGLAYGTHAVTITRSTAAANAICFSRFVTWGPSLPAVPTGAVQLCDYYLLGSFTGSTVNNVNSVSAGVLAKVSSREYAYAGSGWSIGINVGGPNGFLGGIQPTDTTVGDSYSYTFFGTGLVIRHAIGSSGTGNFSVTIDGSLNSSGTALVGCTNAGSGAYNTSGNTTMVAASFTGLTLGVHTVKVILLTGTTPSLLPSDLQIITPVHSPKSNAPGDLQSTQSVGSQALGDGRVFPAQVVKKLANWSQAVGISSSPTTTSTTAVPMPDMVCVIKTTGNPIEVSYSLQAQSNTVGIEPTVLIYVDGQQVDTIRYFDPSTINYSMPLNNSAIVQVAAGVHVVQLFWYVGGSATITTAVNRRNLKVREIS